MTPQSVDHATYSVERRYDASLTRTFAAWSDPRAKARWFGGSKSHFELDFRVGGRELHQGVGPDGNGYTFQALYHDIVPSERIIYSYEMVVAGTRISVSLVTVQMTGDGDGTHLRYTEQGAFLDGADTPSEREHGIGSLLDALAKELR